MYQPLSPKAVEQIHAGSLELLADVGIEVASEEAKKIFRRHGAGINGNNRVTIPPKMVEEAVGHVPAEFYMAAGNNITFIIVPDVFMPRPGGPPCTYSTCRAKEEWPPAGTSTTLLHWWMSCLLSI